MRWPGLVTNAAILGLWLWLHRPVFDHLRIIFTREDFRTSQLILIGTLLLIAQRIRKQKLALRLDAIPHWHTPALVLALVSPLAYLANERWFDINTISACLFGLGSYGLLGLWMQPRAWREGMPAALLLIGALPFGDFIQTFIGYPMRLLTAEVVRRGFAAAGSGSMGLDTILIFENSVAQVDVPCSGVKSLWTGGLFLIAATWIERKPLNLRWLAIALIFALLLFAANLARVAVLVGVGQVMGLAQLAELLHVPLGVLGFAGACAVAVLLLKSQSSKTESQWDSKSVSTDPLPHCPTLLLSFALITTLALFNFAYTARPTLKPSEFHDVRIALPSNLITQPITLRPGELNWLIDDGAEAVERVRFSWGSVSGSLLLVQSTTWRAHHKPERCFENYGLRVEYAETQLLRPNLPVKAMTLSNDKLVGNRSALYWFQSKTKATDDYGTRLWSTFSLQPERWMLVTVLFDGAYAINTPQHKDMTTLAIALQDAVQAQLAK
jgi:exosortase O